MRKVYVVHLFNSKRLQSFHPIREDEISRLMKIISSDVESAGKLTNLSDLMIFLTSSIICCRVAFGKRYEQDRNEIRRFHKLLNEAQAMMGGFFFQDYFPYMGWLDVVNGMKRRLQKNFKDLDNFYQEIIDEHLDPNRPKADVEDFMDLLLGLKRDHLFSNELTWDHIKGVLMATHVHPTTVYPLQQMRSSSPNNARRRWILELFSNIRSIKAKSPRAENGPNLKQSIYEQGSSSRTPSEIKIEPGKVNLSDEKELKITYSRSKLLQLCTPDSLYSSRALRLDARVTLCQVLEELSHPSQATQHRRLKTTIKRVVLRGIYYP